MSADGGKRGTTVDGLARTFADALAARGGTPHLVADPEAARALVAELCAGRPVVADDDPVLAPLLAGLDRVQDPWAAEVGLTTAVVAGAATSTLGLAFDVAHPRRTALVPPVHVAVVPVDRLVATYPEAVAVLGALSPPPSGIRLESGPSSSGDIEQVHIRGMHGPVEVHVVLVGAAQAASAPEAGRIDSEDARVGSEAGIDSEGPVAEPVAQDAPEAAPGAADRAPTDS